MRENVALFDWIIKYIFCGFGVNKHSHKISNGVFHPKMLQEAVESQDGSESEGDSQRSKNIFRSNNGEAFNTTYTPKKLAQRILEKKIKHNLRVRK